MGFESGRDLAAIGAHIERHWGPVHEVFHEIESDYVHIDVHVVRATPERPYHVLVTSGMSDRPMKVPEGAEECGYAELLLALPQNWPVDHASFDDERNYWPVRQLKRTARFPHLYESWLWVGHTVTNGDPPEPFASNVGFCGGLLSSPVLCHKDAWCLAISPEKQIQFLSLIPVYLEELLFAWKVGADALIKRLNEIGVTELVVKDRRNVCEGQ